MEAPEREDDRPRGRFYDARTARPPVFRFERLAPPDYRVMRQFDYVDQLGHWYRVPVDVKENRTDFASIPFFLTWLVPKDGTHTPAAVLHDALIGGRKGVHYDTSAEGTVPDRHADHLFREAMTQSHVPWLRRWIMWAAVSLRTLTVRIDKDIATGEERQRKNWWRICGLVLVVGVWTVLSARMALDVPDLASDSVELPFLADREWLDEILRALIMVGAGAVALTLLFGAILRSARGMTAGGIAGVMIGFLGLPMLASLVGAVGYAVLQRITSHAIDV